LNLQFLDKYLESKTGSEAGFPFGPEVKVYKVSGKMFALISIEADPLRINLKCDPMDALILREQFACIIPGYHMNKDHWNTVILDDSIPVDTLKILIDQSYDLIIAKLPKSKKKILSQQ